MVSNPSSAWPVADPEIRVSHVDLIKIGRVKVFFFFLIITNKKFILKASILPGPAEFGPEHGLWLKITLVFDYRIVNLGFENYPTKVKCLYMGLNEELVTLLVHILFSLSEQSTGLFESKCLNCSVCILATRVYFINGLNERTSTWNEFYKIWWNRAYSCRCISWVQKLLPYSLSLNDSPCGSHVVNHGNFPSKYGGKS